MWIVIILVVVAVGGYFGFRALQDGRAAGASEDFQTELISTGSLTATVGATGTVRADQSALLAFQTSGTVGQVAVKLGDQVSEGDTLASLVRSSLPSSIILAEAEYVSAQRALDDLLNSGQARAAAQLALAQAEDALDSAQYKYTVRQQGNRASDNTIDAAEANLVLAEKEVDAAKAAYDRLSGRPSDDPARALALSNLAAARSRRDSLQRNLNWYLGFPDEVEQGLLEAELATAEARLEDAQREWERVKDGPDPDDIAAAEARVEAARANMELSTINAPFGGIITSVDVKRGDQVNPGTIAFGLADFSPLLVDVQLSEIDVNRVKVGQPVELVFDAIPDQSYEGVVVEIGLVGNSVQGVVNFPVTVELLEPDESVRPGMTAAVNIVVEQIEDVLRVPNRAVRLRDGDRVVYIQEGNGLMPVSVVLGASSETYSEVIAGDIKEGDRVILNPPLEFDSNGPPPFVRGGQ
ncbi:MAG: efflux RND transporter periplasmic adaptor subunit [Anaerolineales bacterium]